MDDITTKVHHDEATNKTTIYREQDCEPVVDEVKRIKEVTDGRGDGVMGYHVGKIPAIIIEQYIEEMGVSFHEFCVDPVHITRICNDPDYKRFRIFEGRI